MANKRAPPTTVMCYHPLFVFNQFGDLERSTAPIWRVEAPLYFRGDAGARRIYSAHTSKPRAAALAEASRLWRQAAVTRPVGRPPRARRRVVAKVEGHPGSPCRFHRHQPGCRSLQSAGQSSTCRRTRNAVRLQLQQILAYNLGNNFAACHSGRNWIVRQGGPRSNWPRCRAIDPRIRL